MSPTPNLADSAPDQANGASKRPVICVFCGSNPGNSPEHMEAARQLAHEFHAKGISLVYGGGTVGLMGEMARTLVQLSGRDAVHGVIPAALVRHDNDTFVQDPKDVADTIDDKVYGRTTIVKDMHERKALMAADVVAGGPGSGFIAMAGGYGTLEELAEVTTWNQLGIHNRGVAVLNVNGYWDGLLKWVRSAVDEGFVKELAADIIVEGTSAADVVDKLLNYKESKGRFGLKWERDGQ